MYELTESQKALSPDIQAALQVAHSLADMGAPIFSAYPDSSTPGDFLRPREWQLTRAGQASHNWINRWKPGMCLAMVTGVVFDVLDIDPRNGGRDGIVDLATALQWDAGNGPREYGMAFTPSEGEHHLIGLTGLAKGKPAKGVDLQAGDSHGEGRGYIYIAPTVRPSKYGENEGQPVAYRWGQEPTAPSTAIDEGLAALVEHIKGSKPARRMPSSWTGLSGALAVDDDPFDGGVEAWTVESADRVINGQLQAVQDAKEGEINNALGGAARVLGRFVAGGYLAEDDAAQMLLSALEFGGVHSDSWNAAHGKKWTGVSVVAEGLARGQTEPWAVNQLTSDQQSHSARTEGQGVPATTAGVTEGESVSSRSQSEGVYPRLLVESAAVMSYWLQQEMGRGRLSGFFARGGIVVHTPRVSELGYVPAPEGDFNGPAEIRPVTGEALAAKLQFLFACYKTVDVKGPDGKKTGETADVPAMFPAIAAKTVVNAPEALQGLRPLRGITHTPMVRADGSILAEPGYDAASGYLFLPGEGVDVRPVPTEPGVEDVSKARDLLLAMVAGFPFATDADLANYLGLLLTPMMRQLTPPAYKMFGIGAHQPGSGKSLLAETVGLVHGMVLRTEVPEDEYGWRQMSAALLSTTSAPVVVLDNITGVLKSSALAGLLTASGEISERELGKSSNLTFTNDRTWIITGNNLSIGGDLARRTVTIMIDPDMAHPETRTDFAIKDLPRWVATNRNEILWSLLVLIRNWVARGSVVQARKQSDSFAAWEAAVGGILATAGVKGAFDDMSGQRASAGGDDDGLAQMLDHLREKFAGRSFSVAEALAPDGGQMTFDSRDWLPGYVLDKLGRSEALGRQSLGYWFRNRVGRWVTAADGAQLVIRSMPMERKVARWMVEQR